MTEPIKNFRNKECMFRVLSGLFFIIIMFAFQPVLHADQLKVQGTREPLDAAQGKGYWGVHLKFNHPVFPLDLAQSITASADGKPIPFSLLLPGSLAEPTEAGKDFLLIPADSGPSLTSVTVSVKRGLSDALGRRTLPRAFSSEFGWLRPISISDLNTFYRSKKERGLRFSVSSPVSERDLARAVSVSPAVKGLRVMREGDDRFVLQGDFQFQSDYVLRVSSITVDAGKAQFIPLQFSFKGPGLQPEISFKSNRSVIELRGIQFLPVTASAVDKIRATLLRVPPVLAPDVHKLLKAGNSISPEALHPRIRDLEKAFRGTRLSRIFLAETKEAADVFIVPEARENLINYSVPLSFRPEPQRGGLWLTLLSDPDGRFKGHAGRLIQITDLAVTYKLSGKSLLIWTTSLYSGEPVGGVSIVLAGTDGLFVDIGITKADGTLLVKNGDSFPTRVADSWDRLPLDLLKIQWAVAAANDDACAIELDTVRLKPFAVSQTSEPREIPEATNGSLFTERGVYRPGETAHFKFVARKYESERIVSPEGSEVQVEIMSPRQDVLYSKKLVLNEFGSCWDAFPIEKYFPVGTYTLQAKPLSRGGKNPAFSRTFLVQEFKAQRHYVSLSIRPNQRTAQDFVSVKITEPYLAIEVKGMYYAGGPVKNGRARWRIELVPAADTMKGYDGFFFGSDDEKRLFLESGEAVLDGEGRLLLSVPLDPRLLTGIYAVEIGATVLDIDGEPATDVEKYNPKPQFLVGIEEHPRRVQVGYSSPVKILVVDDSGKAVSSGKIDAAIMERRYFLVEKRDSQGNLNSLWEEGWVKTIGSQLELTQGQATFHVDLNDPGEYLLAASYESEGKKYSSQKTFRVGWEEYDRWNRQTRENEVRTADEIMVSSSKKDYRIGETVKMRFQTPKPVKRCLVALEKADILEYQVLDVQESRDGYQFKAESAHQPNVFFSVIAPSGRDAFPVYANQTDVAVPTIYYGYADVGVRSDLKTLKLDIEPESPDLKARPGEKKSIGFHVFDESGKGVVAEMAVCVVDDAVLALTRYATPELGPLTRFNVPLAVFSGDLRKNLIGQDILKRISTRPITGGGLGVGELSPALRKDFRPVAFYHPSLRTDDSGKATINFLVPDTMTAYRVFAVVCDKVSGFVSGDRRMVVSKEFSVEPSLPRFLVAGDSGLVPVTLHNRTAQRGVATLTAHQGPGLQVTIAQPQVEVGPWSSAVVKAQIQVNGVVDAGVVELAGSFSSDDNTFQDAVKSSFPVQSRYLPVNTVKTGDFAGKITIDAGLPSKLKDLKSSEISAGDLTAHLSLSTTNWARLEPGLRYLMQYPFGCLEQTSSGIIALAGVRGLVESAMLTGFKAQQVDEFIKVGVERLLSMQTFLGGFSYWPGSIDSSWWASNYAVFALNAASLNGTDVPKPMMEKAVNYLRQQLFSTDWSSYRDGLWTRELAVLNLAAANMISPQELAGFLERYEELSDESKALLLISAKKIGALSGSRLREMITRLNPPMSQTRRDYIDSSYREAAICLLAVLEIAENAPKADALAGYLLKGLRPEGRWISTADTGWCLLALRRYFSASAGKTPQKTTLNIAYGANGHSKVAIDRTTASIQLDPHELLEKGAILIQAESKELIHYVLHLTYPDITSDPKILSRGFSLSKRIENLNGSSKIRVGDILRVTLDIGLSDPDKTKLRDSYQYVAVEDPVPAGIVPINPDLKTEGIAGDENSSSFSADGNQFFPNHTELRDSVVRVFKNEAWSGLYRYSYLARAVIEGEFWMKGSRVSLMYDPELYGRTVGSSITILPADR